ncbi:hypothetical protein BDZ89DRAFT_1151253 [Hymenopellis radicata]|nr:hypothetical protein BDZ89DRAFT_1151253 [Hymenopellis radicata]
MSAAQVSTDSILDAMLLSASELGQYLVQKSVTFKDTQDKIYKEQRRLDRDTARLTKVNRELAAAIEKERKLIDRLGVLVLARQVKDDKTSILRVRHF